MADAAAFFDKFTRDDDAPAPVHISSLAQLEEVREECLKMVTRRAGIAAATSAIPIPLLDLGADTALLQKLNAEVTRRFGLTPEKFQAMADMDKVDSEDKKLIAMMLSNVSGQMLGKGLFKSGIVKGVTKVGEKLFARRLTRLVPLIGPAVSAGISFGTMKLIGNRHVEECYAIARRALEKGLKPTQAPVAALADAATPMALADGTAAPDAHIPPPASASDAEADKTDAASASDTDTKARTDTHAADAVTDAGVGSAPN